MISGPTSVVPASTRTRPATATNAHRKRWARRRRLELPSSAVAATRSTSGSPYSGGSASTRASSSGVAATSPARAPITPSALPPPPVAMLGMIDASSMWCDLAVVVRAVRRPRVGVDLVDDRRRRGPAAARARAAARGTAPRCATARRWCPRRRCGRRPARPRGRRGAASTSGGRSARWSAPAARRASAAWMRSSVWASIAEVASSSTSTFGLARAARARAMRWRWPPESVKPRSPTTVS